MSSSQQADPVPDTAPTEPPAAALPRRSLPAAQPFNSVPTKLNSETPSPKLTPQRSRRAPAVSPRTQIG